MKKNNNRKRSHNATENQIQSYYEAKELGFIQSQELFLVHTLKLLRRPVSRRQLEKITKIRCSSLTRALANLQEHNKIFVAKVNRCTITGMPVQFYSLIKRT